MLLEGAGQLGWRDPPRPVCEAGKGEAPLDARLMRLLILLFGVTRLRDPPEHNQVNLEVTQGEGGEQSGGGATMQWDREDRGTPLGTERGKDQDIDG